MAGVNKAIIMGRLGRDPETTYTAAKSERIQPAQPESERPAIGSKSIARIGLRYSFLT